MRSIEKKDSKYRIIKIERKEETQEIKYSREKRIAEEKRENELPRAQVIIFQEGTTLHPNTAGGRRF